MAKMIKVSKAEYDVLVAAYSHDGLKIAMLEAELKQAKEDIKQMLVISNNRFLCDFCKCNPVLCENCEKQAEWRGWKEDEH